MVSILIFWGTSKLFHNGYIIFHSDQKGTKVPLLHILANICYFPFIIHILESDSLFDLISISLILSDVRHFSYVYWSFLWRNVIEAFYTFFKLSYLPAVVLKLSCNTFLYILDLVPCSKFADTSSHFIGRLSVDCWGNYPFFTW